MRQFVAIAHNALMELIRQPIYLLLMSTSSIFMVFLASVYYFGFGDDPTMVKQSVLAVMLLTGLFGAVLSAASSVAHEIRSGTALAVLSKPVGRAQFLLAKFTGVALSLTLMAFVNTLAALLASRMAYDVYGEPDRQALVIFFVGLVLAYAAGGFSNYFLRRPFVADAVWGVVLMVTLAFILINFFDRQGESQAWGTGTDWRIIPAALLILFALWLLAGLAIACTTRWELIPTLAFCSAIFLAGLMSDYFFSEKAHAGSIWANFLYTLLPNWQLFWAANALEANKSIPWSYVLKSFGYLTGYLGAILALALILFEDRELS